MTTGKERAEVMARLIKLGVSVEHANQLRRVANTLRNWFELECGTGDARVTHSIERDEATGKPFMRMQYLDRGWHGTAKKPQWIDKKFPVPDREAGARKCLAGIMAGYRRNRLIAYVQGDCRSASVYILRKGWDIRKGEDINRVYSRGVAVY